MFFGFLIHLLSELHLSFVWLNMVMYCIYIMFGSNKEHSSSSSSSCLLACVRACVRVYVRACVRARECVMCLQYTIIVFHPG